MKHIIRRDPLTKDLTGIDIEEAGKEGAWLQRQLNPAQALAFFGLPSPLITMTSGGSDSTGNTVIGDYSRRGLPGSIAIEGGPAIELGDGPRKPAEDPGTAFDLGFELITTRPGTAPETVLHDRTFNPHGQLESVRQGPVEVRYEYLPGTDWVRHTDTYHDGVLVKKHDTVHEPINGRVVSITESNPAGTVLASFAYTYHPRRFPRIDHLCG